MISKKICLLGSFAVGKTSLVRRLTESIFDEKYKTTIGVKIDKKLLCLEGKSVQLMIWDLEGRDEFATFRHSYLRGVSGYFLVVDITRPDSLKVAVEMQEEVEQAQGVLPFVLLLSKSDLIDERRLDQQDLHSLLTHGWHIMETSSKTGLNVERAFNELAKLMLAV